MMKTIQAVLVIVISVLILSCTREVGPAGPPGPQGPQGEQGESAFVFEYDNVDFIGPDYEVILPYPEDFEALDADVALVYLLWEVTQDGNGNQLEVWRQLPQSVQTELGDINYNFDFTVVDVRLFLVPEFDPSNLLPIDTDDWVVRTVIVPGNFWGSRHDLDLSDYNAVKEAFGLPELELPKAKKRRE